MNGQSLWGAREAGTEEVGPDGGETLQDQEEVEHGGEERWLWSRNDQVHVSAALSLTVVWLQQNAEILWLTDLDGVFALLPGT